MEQFGKKTVPVNGDGAKYSVLFPLKVLFLIFFKRNLLTIKRKNERSHTFSTIA